MLFRLIRRQDNGNEVKDLILTMLSGAITGIAARPRTELRVRTRRHSRSRSATPTSPAPRRRRRSNSVPPLASDADDAENVAQVMANIVRVPFN